MRLVKTSLELLIWFDKMAASANPSVRTTNLRIARLIYRDNRSEVIKAALLNRFVDIKSQEARVCEAVCLRQDDMGKKKVCFYGASLTCWLIFFLPWTCQVAAQWTRILRSDEASTRRAKFVSQEDK